VDRRLRREEAREVLVGTTSAPSASSAYRWSVHGRRRRTCSAAEHDAVGSVPARKLSVTISTHPAATSARRPVARSIDARPIPSGSGNSFGGTSASDCSMNACQIGSAASAPVSCEPRLFFWSNPTHTPTTRSGV
jgi:hypothetical protein